MSSQRDESVLDTQRVTQTTMEKHEFQERLIIQTAVEIYILQNHLS